MPKPVVFLAALHGDWVPGRVAGYLARHLSDEFEIVGMAGPQEPPPLGGVAVAIFPHFADLRLMNLLRPDTRTIVTVYDHFLWRWDRTSVNRLRESLAMCDALLTTNALIASDMRAYVGLPAYVDACQNGVDADLFSPGAPAAPQKPDGKLVVGWAGTDGPTKNLDLVRAIGTVPGVELRVQDHAKFPRPFLAMPDWYRGLDLFTCMSSSEGTPNPVIEAAACGVPFLSTDVGNVRELYESLPTGPRPGIIVPQEPKIVLDAVRELEKDRERLALMGAAGRAAILARWTWPMRVEPFRRAIRAVLGKPVNRMRLTRRIKVF